MSDPEKTEIENEAPVAPPTPATPPQIPAETTKPPESLAACLEMLLRNPVALMYHLNMGKPLKLSGYLILISVFSLAVFGLVLGLFSAGQQLWLAPLKICGGTLFSAAICLPSLYIFACLSGMDVKLSSLVGALLAMVALTGVLLLGFAPVSWVFSQSTESVAFFGFLNLAFWAIGLFFGLGILKRLSAQKAGGHIFVWSCMFVLVCLQMTSTLRPIIGTADTVFPKEKKFFLTHWFNTMGMEGANSNY